MGVYLHTLWVIYLGYGVIGGIALGIGCISPVSTLIRWFPGRPGMAIMGFGGGALIASPLSVWLMKVFSTPTHVGVMETFIVLGIVYFIFMMVGAAIVRVPAPGWKPEGYEPPAEASKLITKNDVYVYDPALGDFADAARCDEAVSVARRQRAKRMRPAGETS